MAMNVRVIPDELLPTADDLMASVRSSTAGPDSNTERPLYRLDDGVDDAG